MKFIDAYVIDFTSDNEKVGLADKIREVKASYDAFSVGNAIHAFEEVVEFYNWLGSKHTKETYGVNSNLARNLPGALMQDWLIHVMLSLTKNTPELFLFTEVKVLFGNYPLWEKGGVVYRQPSEKSDLAVGFLQSKDGEIIKSKEPWPNKVYTAQRELNGCSVIPLITVNSKIRVSQSEFFDWQGREQLMTKGHPHCLSVQVALRKEMDYSVVEAAQAGDKFFLLGAGGETNVCPDREELIRFIKTVGDHIQERMF
ncbi:hypothetical protein [Pseudomonas sp. LBUM920]|uniref:hypothetical protein n=1 Tax=Pseudomonas sp. LBUM920 TaxID=2126069 RepID=UPI000F55EACD|nr:hypothetical protein [Pseudomonas sp. LBUM920]AZF66253.1 hypothetical protein C4J83_5297 [Pseudomonas sp. LBUM920]